MTYRVGRHNNIIIMIVYKPLTTKNVGELDTCLKLNSTAQVLEAILAIHVCRNGATVLVRKASFYVCHQVPSIFPYCLWIEHAITISMCIYSK